ncbi:MAG TPA: aldo/keto reductase [Gemmatimonadales bacterium]|nr:aldo/keto reductase [Gemmatimonadales bacterium]
MTLPLRALGTSGLDITAVGFGAWAIGGGDWAFGWGPQDDADSLAAMRRALELGINWIDTAAVYGLGRSEEVVGRLLAELPATDRPLVFTKCGLQWDERNRALQPRRVLAPKAIRQEVEASLRRLGVERIDLYQFHWPDESGTPIADSWSAMARLVEEGKVRAAGVSNFPVTLLAQCEAIRHVDSLQPPFSLVRRQAAEREIPWCAEHGTGVIVYSPMQSGLLTDGFTAARVAAFAQDDWRRRGAEFQQPNLGRNLALRDALVPIARRHGSTVSAVAAAWTLAWPGVTGAIVGARHAKQVEGWIGGATLELDGRDRDEIAAAIERTGAGAGPTRPTAGVAGRR